MSSCGRFRQAVVMEQPAKGGAGRKDAERVQSPVDDEDDDQELRDLGFLCPITQEVLREPVVAADGHTYEREALEKWLSGGRNTSPMTGAPLTSRAFRPNHTLRGAITKYEESKPRRDEERRFRVDIAKAIALREEDLQAVVNKLAISTNAAEYSAKREKSLKERIELLEVCLVDEQKKLADEHALRLRADMDVTLLEDRLRHERQQYDRVTFHAHDGYGRHKKDLLWQEQWAASIVSVMKGRIAVIDADEKNEELERLSEIDRPPLNYVATARIRAEAELQGRLNDEQKRADAAEEGISRLALQLQKEFPDVARSFLESGIRAPTDSQTNLFLQCASSLLEAWHSERTRLSGEVASMRADIKRLTKERDEAVRRAQK